MHVWPHWGRPACALTATRPAARRESDRSIVADSGCEVGVRRCWCYLTQVQTEDATGALSWQRLPYESGTNNPPSVIFESLFATSVSTFTFQVPSYDRPTRSRRGWWPSFHWVSRRCAGCFTPRSCASLNSSFDAAQRETRHRGRSPGLTSTRMRTPPILLRGAPHSSSPLHAGTLKTWLAELEVDAGVLLLNVACSLFNTAKKSIAELREELLDGAL